MTNKLAITIAVIALISAIVSMCIVNSNRNAFARSSRHDHADDKANHRRGCIYQKHVFVDQKHGSDDFRQEEILLSSPPGLPQQQLYLNHIHAAGSP